MDSEFIIYQTEDGQTKIQTRLEEETVWLTQSQMATLFSKAKSTINEHIKNIFKEGELDEDSVVRNFRTTASDGKNYNTNFYNLDVMYMKDWIARLDDFLRMTGNDILDHAGKVSHQKALDKAHEEYDKYKKQENERLSKVEKDFIDHLDEKHNKLAKGKKK